MRQTRSVVLPKDLAVDLGTSTTQVFVRGRGVVIDEPTVAAVNRRSGDVVDVGRAALHLVDRDAEKLEAVWPVRNGAVADAAVAQRFLVRLLRPYKGGFLDRTRVVACVSSSSTPMERRAVCDAARRAGASHVYLIEHAVAAALGGDLPVHEAVGTMVVVVGAGITEAALLSLGCVVGVSTSRTGIGEIDQALKHTMRRDYGMTITDRTAEEMKLAASQLAAEDASSMIEARGQMVMDGSVATALLERDELQPAVDGYVERTIEVIKGCLVQAPPEIAQDLFSRGIHLTGGGALLGGLPEAVGKTFGLQVRLMQQPAQAGALGAGKCLEAIENLKTLFVGEV